MPVLRWLRNGRIDLRPWIRNDWSSPGKGDCLLCNNLRTRSLGRLHFYASALALIAILWASGGPPCIRWISRVTVSPCSPLSFLFPFSLFLSSFLSLTLSPHLDWFLSLSTASRKTGRWLWLATNTTTYSCSSSSHTLDLASQTCLNIQQATNDLQHFVAVRIARSVTLSVSVFRRFFLPRVLVNP